MRDLGTLALRDGTLTSHPHQQKPRLASHLPRTCTNINWRSFPAHGELPCVPAAAPSLPRLPPSLLASLPPSSLPSLLPRFPPSFLASLPPSSLPSLLPHFPPSLLPRFPRLLPRLLPSLLPSLSPSLLPSLSPSLLPRFPPSLPHYFRGSSVVWENERLLITLFLHSLPLIFLHGVGHLLFWEMKDY
ncbi:hypothetical protein Pcinc_044156 [Petrolisthes cinctipes]|uniref:Uncharacterized protein n=1 Tax=Petrolisthes cinctipes TaxID=88211 RepID=A0AAE1EEP1_PETCI|nr:hypothetical protein Pcinc_044156 [Petrolisthes cinctipes]